MTHIPSNISKLLERLGTESTQLQFLYLDKQPDTVQLGKWAQNLKKTATELDELLNLSKKWKVTYCKEARSRKEDKFLSLLNERLLYSSQKHDRQTVMNTINALLKQADSFEYARPDIVMKPLELIVAPTSIDNMVKVFRKNTGGTLFCRVELMEVEA